MEWGSNPMEKIIQNTKEICQYPLSGVNMATQFVTAIVLDQADSFIAGKTLAEQVKHQLHSETIPDVMILFGAVQYDYAAVFRGIRQIFNESMQIIGCTSAGQFSQEHVTKQGLSCACIKSDTHRFLSGISTNLKSDPVQAVSNIVQTFPSEVEGYPYHSAIMFVDGLAGKGEEAVLAASSLLGPMVKFAGGAAADNLTFRETFVLYQDQSLVDAISLCLIASKRPLIISVKHGHRPISPPLRITKSKGNILYEVENKPALEVWKFYLKDRLKKQNIDLDQLSPEEISKVLLKYEAGLLIGNNEYKIRFPASSNPDGSLNFVCSMMEGAVIKIMDSSEQDQIESAREAARAALQHSRGVKLAGAVIFDCACRAMILKEEFSKAVDTNKETFGNLPFAGCETYGEIAMEMGQMSGFHNTTTVIMLFPE